MYVHGICLGHSTLLYFPKVRRHIHTPFMYTALGDLCTYLSPHPNQIEPLFQSSKAHHFVRSTELLANLYTVHTHSSLSCTVPMQPTATVTIPIATDIGCIGTRLHTYVHLRVCMYIHTDYIHTYRLHTYRLHMYVLCNIHLYLCYSQELQLLCTYMHIYVTYVRIYQLCALGGVFPSCLLVLDPVLSLLCTYVRMYACHQYFVVQLYIRGNLCVLSHVGWFAEESSHFVLWQRL